ncbi:MAG TPA: DUF6600 domain-containing protein [Bryobacteraceae bacterium]|nr:DUF6600 domain-containing protein [Bryobacteraceae bacterium]
MKRNLLAILVVAGCAASLLAQEPDGQYEPGRAVARISVLNGDVSVRRGDSGDVVAAAINSPVMADDRILTGSSSRAEVELDFANMLRVGPSSEVRFVGMDVKSFQMQVAAGTVTLRVLRPGQAQTEVDTPSVAVRPLGQGTYRITVLDDGSSAVTVRSGEADIYGSNGSEQLAAGQTMNARGSAADTEFQIVQAIPLDSWDRWNEDRDRYLERSQSYRHVSPDVSGAEDLDQYGQWVNDPTYGSVWAPTVPSGWAPYQAGRWVWEDYYGWTWVSYDPWGWAPYHYGRWFFGPVGWCWYPGPAFARYYWSPALVGFFGWGGGVGIGVGFGFGGVGWVPLAPFEAFHPWWGRGFYGGFRNGVVNNTTIVNNVNIYNTYRNARVNGAVSGINAADFGRNTHFTALNRSQIQQAGMVHGAVPIAPDRSSLRMSDRAVSGNFPQSRVQKFASRSQAPAVQHASFDQQRSAMQRMSGSSFGQASRAGAGNSVSYERSMPNTGRAAQRPGGNVPNNPSGEAMRGSSGANSSPAVSHGWGRFGEPIHGAAPQSQAPGGRSFNAGSSGGWQRFENTRPGGGSTQNFAPGPGSFGGSQAVHISPSIVQPRTAPRNYEAPRSFGGASPAPRNYEAPRSFGGGGGMRSAPSSGGGGGGQRGFGGGGGSHAGGGGGGHSGGGGHGGGGGHR